MKAGVLIAGTTVCKFGHQDKLIATIVLIAIICLCSFRYGSLYNYMIYG